MDPEIDRQGSSELLSHVEVTHERDDDIIEGYVPIEFINQEDVPVDKSHVSELVESIKKESTGRQQTGQLSPVLLGAVPGEDGFRIIDGFHRTAAITAMGESQVYATIKKDSPLEDIIDLRIVAAKSHQKIRFSRIVEWIEEAWEKTTWSANMSASSAFTMEMLENNGGYSGLSTEEITDVKEWIQLKCEQWDVKINKIDQYLRVAKKADPALVARVRDRTGGHKLEDVTSAHLTQIVRFLPDTYDLQNVVADAAITNTLTVAQTNSLALAISRAKTYEDVDRYINSKVWRAMGSASNALRKRRHIEIDGDNKSEAYVEALQTKFLDDQVAIAELLIENAIMTGAYTPKLDDASPAVMELTIRLGLDGQSDPAGPDEIAQITEDTVQLVWDPEKIGAIAERSLALHGLMVGLARRRYNMDNATAEDLASESTIALLNAVNKDKISPDLSGQELRNMLARIVTNRCLNEIRGSNVFNGARKTIPLFNGNGEHSDLIDRIGVHDDNLGKLLDATENPDFIKTILPFLSERERRVTVLKGVFDLELDDIAAIMGTNVPAVKALQQKLRGKALELSEKIRLESIES